MRKEPVDPKHCAPNFCETNHCERHGCNPAPGESNPSENLSDCEMYAKKAAFFDGQADADWASDPYGASEWEKLDHLFSEIGDLSGKRILEPGCGSGRLTAILSEKVGDSGWVSALDISPEMTKRAKARLTSCLNVAVETRSVESFTPPVSNNGHVRPPGTTKDESPGRFNDGGFHTNFDMVLCHQVFPHLEDKTACLNHFNRLLKPDGVMVLFHFIDFDKINDTHRKAGSAVAHDMMPDDAQMVSMFNESGFSIRFIRNNPNGYFLIADKDDEKF